MLRRTLVLAAIAPLLVHCSIGSTDPDATPAATPEVTGDPGPVQNPHPAPPPAPTATPDAGSTDPGPLPPAFAFCGQSGSVPSEKLPIDVKSGAATEVTLTGSDELLQKIASFESKRKNCETSWMWGTQGFTIDWGDDPMGTRVDFTDQPKLASGCTDTIRHTFSVPGKYVVTGALSHPGPNDGTIVDWSAATEVDVAGGDGATTLDLADPLDGKTIYYEGAIPVAWQWRPAKKLALELAITDDAGTALATEAICPSGYVGKGKRSFMMAGSATNAFLANGPVQAHARIRLFDGGTMVLEKTGGAFTYTPQMDPSFLPPKVTTAAGHSMTLGFSTYLPACLSYSIDWGDGSAATISEQTMPKDGCPLNKQDVNVAHTYAKAGSYEVKLKTNEFDLGKRLAEIIPYQLVTANVP